MRHEPHNDPQVKTTENARQGERKPGMPSVLTISTVVAAIILLAVLASFAIN